MATALAAWCFLSYGQIKEKGTNNNLTIKFNDDLEDEFNTYYEASTYEDLVKTRIICKSDVVLPMTV
jgi:hypothetical protein